MIALFSVNNDFVVYPMLLVGAISGAAAYFKADEFFIYCTAFVGSLMTIQGLTTFLDG